MSGVWDAVGGSTSQTEMWSDRNMGMGAAMVKMPKYDGFMTWTVFHWQFENVSDHTGGGGGGGVPPVEAMHLLTIFQG
jgi:hypothetical protein